MLTQISSPPITVADTELRRLEVVAMTAAGHPAEASDALNYELDRARIVAAASLPPDLVRIGSTVTYRLNQDRRHTATLVYPEAADPMRGRLSVLTPVGTALLGLSVGQSIVWRQWNHAANELTVLAVTSNTENEDV